MDASASLKAALGWDRAALSPSISSDLSQCRPQVLNIDPPTVNARGKQRGKLRSECKTHFHAQIRLRFPYFSHNAQTPFE
jgi:hypothetical protein